MKCKLCSTENYINMTTCYFHRGDLVNDKCSVVSCGYKNISHVLCKHHSFKWQIYSEKHGNSAENFQLWFKNQ